MRNLIIIVNIKQSDPYLAVLISVVVVFGRHNVNVKGIFGNVTPTTDGLDSDDVSTDVLARWHTVQSGSWLVPA